MTRMSHGDDEMGSQSPIKTVRRVVIGNGRGGRSMVTFAGPCEHFSANPTYAGVTRNSLWRERAEVDCVSAEDHAAVMSELSPGGVHFYAVEIAPRTEVPMHGTPTVDFHYATRGAVVCVLEEGEVEVRAGDVMVLRGAAHGWSNRTDEPFTSVAVMMDVSGRLVGRSERARERSAHAGPQA